MRRDKACVTLKISSIVISRHLDFLLKVMVYETKLFVDHACNSVLLNYKTNIVHFRLSDKCINLDRGEILMLLLLLIMT